MENLFLIIVLFFPTPAINSHTPASLHKMHPSDPVCSFLPCKQIELYSLNPYLFALIDSMIRLSARFHADSSVITTCKVTSPTAFHTSVSFTRNLEYSYEQESHKVWSGVTEPSTVPMVQAMYGSQT